MTNKIQEIREEVARIQLYTQSEVLKDILDYIDKVQEEPVSEDLEEEINRYIESLSPEDIKAAPFCSIEDCARHFAEWQKEKDSNLPEVWDRESLDEYAYQVAYDLSNDWMKDFPTWDDVEVACKLGAKWKEEQMTSKSK